MRSDADQIWTTSRRPRISLAFDSGQRVIILAPGLEGANSRELNSKCTLQGFSDIDWGDRQHFEAKHVGLNLRTSHMQLLERTFLSIESIL